MVTDRDLFRVFPLSAFLRSTCPSCVMTKLCGFVRTVRDSPTRYFPMQWMNFALPRSLVLISPGHVVPVVDDLPSDPLEVPMLPRFRTEQIHSFSAWCCRATSRPSSLSLLRSVFTLFPDCGGMSKGRDNESLNTVLLKLVGEPEAEEARLIGYLIRQPWYRSKNFFNHWYWPGMRPLNISSPPVRTVICQLSLYTSIPK